MALVEVIKWNAPNDIYAWKFPSQEIATWSQLIVSESQEALLLIDGEVSGPFGPGRHTLDTQNIPILTSLLKIPFGGRSPFAAEVWFIQKAMSLDIKWGTPDAMQILDPSFGILVPVRAFGQFGIQISDAKKFLLKLVGTMPAFNQAAMTSYFRGVMLTKAKTLIASAIIQSKISVLEISARLEEISEAIRQKLEGDLEEFGVKLVNFYVNSINIPEDNPAVVKLRESLSRRADMGILGYNYQQQRSFDVLEGAAKNPGGMAGSLAGAGMGVGMGVAMGGMMGQGMGQMLSPNPMAPETAAPAPAPAAAKEACPQCRKELGDGVKFCAECGAAIARCRKCNRVLAPDNPNCPACGAGEVQCPKCKQPNSMESKFCAECGAPLFLSCCGKKIPAGTKFCPECGKKLEEQP